MHLLHLPFHLILLLLDLLFEIIFNYEVAVLDLLLFVQLGTVNVLQLEEAVLDLLLPSYFFLLSALDLFLVSGLLALLELLPEDVGALQATPSPGLLSIQTLLPPPGLPLLLLQVGLPSYIQKGLLRGQGSPGAARLV